VCVIMATRPGKCELYQLVCFTVTHLRCVGLFRVNTVSITVTVLVCV